MTKQLTAVIGYPIEHSKSPQMLNAAFAAKGMDAEMIAIGVPPEGFADAIADLRAKGAIGASITAPHKLAAHKLCTDRSSAVSKIGAVNCIEFRGSAMTGHNTDCYGFVDALRAAGFGTRGHVVLLGAGGAARAVRFNFAEVEVVARNPVPWTTITPWAEIGEAFKRADLVVDCTPMPLRTDQAELVDALPIDQLRPDARIVSLGYHKMPILLERCAARGHEVLDGRAMLVHQGARAFHIWTGRDAPVDVMRAALDEALTKP